MQYYIGIDGGGSKTFCVLTRADFKILASSYASGSNPLSVGFKESASVLENAIKQVYIKIKTKDKVTIVAGIAGCGRKSHALKLEQILKKKLMLSGIRFEHLEIISDAEIALEGALAGKQGAILIAGTGSILIGKDNSGNIFKIGGYGKILGDEGSGYSIGRKALNAVSKYFDGRGEQTILANYLSEKFGITNRDELITKIYSENLDVAAVAPLVLKAAGNRDKVCCKILDDEVKELLLYINSFKKQTNTKKLTLCLSGGLLINKNYLSIGLKRKLKARVNIIKAKHPPEIGAVIVARSLNKF